MRISKTKTNAEISETRVSCKCSICDSDAEKLTTLKDSRIFYHCDQCSFSGLDTKFFLNPSEEKSRYDLHQNTIEDLGYVGMFEKFIEFSITPYKNSITKLLDYGSGPQPVLAEILRAKDYQVEIYDSFYAQNKFKPGSFDLITSTEVFEHFHNPIKEIEKIIDLTKPNGYIAVLTRFCPELEKFKSWFYKDDKTHVSFYTVKTFEYIAKRFNLKILKHDDFEYIVFQKCV